MRKILPILFYLFVIQCVFLILLTSFGAKETRSEHVYSVNCYITFEPCDGADREYYDMGDSVYLVAHIDFDILPATPTDLGSPSISDFDITWLMSPDGESWSTIGVGERFELVLNAETAGSYYRFVATRK